MGRIIIFTGWLVLLGGVAWAGSCLEGDCRSGYGTFQWNDGAKFTGNFFSGDPDGKGIYTDPDGKEFQVTYQEGRPVATTPITKEEKERKAKQQEANRYNEAGLMYLRKKDLVSAIFFFNKAITLWPENQDFHRNYRAAKGIK